MASGTNSTALGQLSTASGSSSTALGVASNASGYYSTALGQQSTASGDESIALGQFSAASGFDSTALGQESTASGDFSTALGQLSTASAYASTALGQFSTAAFANSTAVGSGVATTRDNQMSLGAADNTYTAAGINSAASTAAQSGPVRFVTADDGGNLATTDANTIVTGSSAYQNLQSDVGQNSNDIRNLQSDSRQNTEGVAMAIALGGSAGILPDDKTFAASSNIGTFQGQSALGFGAVGRLNDNWFLNAGVGTGISHGTVGGRAGVTYAW